MKPEERAKRAIESSAIPPNYPQWWAVAISPAQVEALTNSIRREICNAISEAINEDRKSRPHIFIGRNDRDCELCGNPDRDEIHCVKREWMSNAIKQEREACALIGDERIAEINRTYPAQPGPSREWKEKAERLSEVNHYRSMIRDRSKS
jgi:hypothetical protein